MPGATVIELDGRASYDDAIARLRADSAAAGWTVVADSSWDGYDAVPTDIMCGYTQLFAEALDQMDEPPTHCLVQAGVGGLLAAGAAYLSKAHPSVRVVSVEPVDAGCILENAKAGRAADSLLECEGAADSNMQGLNCNTPSPITWPLIVSHTHDFVAIGDEWAREAVRSLYPTHGLWISESGAAGYAGLLAALSDKSIGIDQSSRVMVVLSEGVTNVRSFNEILGAQLATDTPAETAAAIAARCGIELVSAE
jgi:diaminopropionate ammonia-lyase